MRRRAFLGVGLAGLAAGLGSAPQAWSAEDNAIQLDTAIRLLSKARREAGLPVLDLQPDLAAAAQRHVVHMANTGCASHLGPNGENPAVRARLAGFVSDILGEALAETHDDTANTIAAWLSDPATRDVLLDPDARTFGLAALNGADARTWWSVLTGA